MKKLIFLLGVLLPLGLFSQFPQPMDLQRFDGAVSRNDLKPVAPEKVHPLALKARRIGEQPSSFKGVTYRLQPNVRSISPSQKNALRLKQDGVLDLTGAPAFRPHPDSIYFDPQSELIFQAQPVEGDQMLLLRPGLAEVFENIDMSDQVVPVKLANTVWVARDNSGKDIPVSSSGAGENYAVFMAFDKTRFNLKEDGKDSLNITLTGTIVLTNPRIEGKYTKSNGYALIFRTSERVNLKVETSMKFGKEIEYPLWGTEIEAGDIGKCKLAISMVVDINGEINLVVDIDQGIDLGLGAKGKTYYYFPTSMNTVAELQQHCDISYEVKTKMKAFAGVNCSAKMNFKGYEILNMYVKGGMEGTVETSGNDLLADVGLRVKSAGKVVSKKFTLIDHYTSLWKIQTANTAGYKMQVYEACAWGDYVAGEIYRDLGQGKESYHGNLSLLVTHPDNSTGSFQATTNNEGIFIARNIPLKRGDKVQIKLEQAPSPGPAVEATIPFREIKLFAADYFNESAYGMVAAARSEWAKSASSTSAGSNIPAAAIQKSFKATAIQNIGSIASSPILDKINEFNRNLITYSGPVSFWVKESENARPKREDILTSNIQRAPLGMFEIAGLSFKPGQFVQARIEAEGFIITSDWIPTDGLILSPFENEGFSYNKSLKSESLGAENSFVIVSAIRGNKTPVGTAILIRGFDAPHAAPINKVQVPEFPEATHAGLWFSKTVDLRVLPEHPGTAVAETGPWEAGFTYLTPAAILDPAKDGKHPFEMVSYLYKNKEIGYTNFIQECHSCKSPANIIERVGKNQLLKEERINPGQKGPMPTAPKVNPGVRVNTGVRGKM